MYGGERSRERQAMNDSKIGKSADQIKLIGFSARELQQSNSRFERERTDSMSASHSRERFRPGTLLSSGGLRYRFCNSNAG